MYINYEKFVSALEKWRSQEHGEANSILKEVIEFAEKIAEKDDEIEGDE